MLAEQRHFLILDSVERAGSASVQELAEKLEISESTIRRDLEKLDAQGRLVKVHGGATRLERASVTRDLAVMERSVMNAQQKDRIAAYAASLVGPDDFVYIDAGTSTAAMVDHLMETDAIYVTDSVSLALRMVERGLNVIVLGGELKGATQALVGPDALDSLARYNFSIGFWGTNGATIEQGFTTPDRSEAVVKRISMKHTNRRYVLADATKLGAVASVTFADFCDATILTDSVPEAFSTCENVMEVA